MKRVAFSIAIIMIIALFGGQGVFAQNSSNSTHNQSYLELKEAGLLGGYTNEQLLELQRTNPGTPPSTRSVNPNPSVYVQSQVVTAGPDTTVCAGSTVTLTATVISGVANSLSLSDDQWSGVIALPFNFTFYGNTYSNCIVGSNGEVGFNTGNAGGYNTWPIGNGMPSAFPADLQNTIMGPWEDLLQPSGGTLRYATVGNSPNRIFVVEWCNVTMFGGFCSGGTYTGQIMLYEGSNIVETHILNKPDCPSWNGGYAIHGVQNAGGTIADIVPGRNYPSQWTAASEGYRFTPNGFNYNISSIPYTPAILATPTITWYVNGSPVGSGATITVTPASTTNYVAQVTSTCGSVVYSDTATVTIAPTLTAPTAVPTSICPNSTASVTANCGGNCQWYDASTGGTLLGNGSPYTTPVLNSSTTYYVQLTNGLCTSPRTAVTVSVGNMNVNAVAPLSNCPTSSVGFNTTYSGATNINVTIVPVSGIPSGIATSGQVCTDPNNADCVGHFKSVTVTTPPNVGATINALTLQGIYVSLDTLGATNSHGCGKDDRLWLKSPAGTLIQLVGTKPSNQNTTNKYKPIFTVAGSLGVCPDVNNVSYNGNGYQPDWGTMSSVFIGENPYAGGGIWTLYLNDNVGAGGCTAVSRITEFSMTFRTYPPVSYNWSSSAGCSSYLSNPTTATPLFNPPPPNTYYNCVYTVTVTDAAGCTGTATINAGCSTLPVELLSYTGKNTINGNLLKWTTATETNNSYFTIERSINGTDFTEFRRIPSRAVNGNSTTSIDYSLTDANVKQGTYYYRLIQTDIDGSSKYNGTIAIAVKAEREIFNILPNPTSDKAEVIYECNNSDESASLKIYDHAGNQVMTKEITCSEGINKFSVDLSGKPDGIYLFTITTGDNLYKARLVKSR